MKQAILKRFPSNATYITELKAFSNMTKGDDRIQDAQILLGNGSFVSGFDHIIFATGFRKSFPFLGHFHNK